MKVDYWDVSDPEVSEKTGKPLSEWMQILCCLESRMKRSDDFVTSLQQEFGVPLYWARALTMQYLRRAVK